MITSLDIILRKLNIIYDSRFNIIHHRSSWMLMMYAYCIPLFAYISYSKKCFEVQLKLYFLLTEYSESSLKRFDCILHLKPFDSRTMWYKRVLLLLLPLQPRVLESFTKRSVFPTRRIIMLSLSYNYFATRLMTLIRLPRKIVIDSIRR